MDIRIDTMRYEWYLGGMKLLNLMILIAISSLGARADDSKSTSLATLRSILKDCYSSNLKVAPLEGFQVNGHALNPSQAKNVQWIAECVVPNLPGSREQQAEVAARTTWWALREGVLDRTGARLFGYSNCHERGKDQLRTKQPGYNCSTNIWQVGMAAGQVANYSKESYVKRTDQVISALDPSLNEAALLGWTASLAGYEEKSPTHRSIVNSTGRVKRSWLLRNPLVGFLLVERLEVRAECLIDKKKWCFSGNYPAAKNFSHTEKGMRRSIADLKKYFL